MAHERRYGVRHSRTPTRTETGRTEGRNATLTLATDDRSAIPPSFEPGGLRLFLAAICPICRTLALCLQSICRLHIVEYGVVEHEKVASVRQVIADEIALVSFQHWLCPFRCEFRRWLNCSQGPEVRVQERVLTSRIPLLVEDDWSHWACRSHVAVRRRLVVALETTRAWVMHLG